MPAGGGAGAGEGGVGSRPRGAGEGVVAWGGCAARCAVRHEGALPVRREPPAAWRAAVLGADFQLTGSPRRGLQAAAWSSEGSRAAACAARAAARPAGWGGRGKAAVAGEAAAGQKGAGEGGASRGVAAAAQAALACVTRPAALLNG